MTVGEKRRELLGTALGGVLLVTYALVNAAESGTPIPWSPAWFGGGLLLGVGAWLFPQYTRVGRSLEGKLFQSAAWTLAVLVVGFVLLAVGVSSLEVRYDGDVPTGLLGLAAGSAFGVLAVLGHEDPANHVPGR